MEFRPGKKTRESPQVLPRVADVKFDDRLDGGRPARLPGAEATGLKPAWFVIKTMKILVVDDNALALRVMCNHLLKDGHEIISAGCGADCLKILLGPQPPGVAILDWMMPDMDGLEVIRRVRLEQKHSRTYLIMTTCMQSKEDLVQALDAGADAYLFKPYDSSIFRAHVRAGMRIAEYMEKLRLHSLPPCAPLSQEEMAAPAGGRD